MKKLITFLAIIATTAIFAQAPQGFNYQATVRNSTGALIVNQNVYFKFNLMLNSPSSVPVFSETHYTPTDDLGQVNIVIGQGTATVGTFSTINWGTGNYYLGIELNTGSGYIAMGTTQLLSVPYALYANSSGNAPTSIPNLAAVLAVNNGANNLKISNLANPTAAQDAATKNYVDSKIPNGTNAGDNLTWNGTNWVVSSASTTAQLPQLTTITATGITPFAASSGGTITGDGGFSIVSKGVAWSILPNPTINDNFTNNGLGATSFTSALNNLLPGTSYFYRAYATNTLGTGYGMSFSFTTPGLATVTTTEIYQINSISALTGGNITSNGGANVTARGVCWSTSPNPTIALTTKTINGSGTGFFSSSLTQLTPATTYYVSSYATNAAGTAYGNELSFTTSVALPSLTTSEVTSITSSTANSGGTITNNGGGVISASGIVWGTVTNPTIISNVGITTDGTLSGTFTSNLTGLNPGTTYYVRSYATNSAGTGYGNQITFSALAVLPIVSTTGISQINSISALTGGNITSNGGANVTARGVCWSTSPNPTIALTTKTIDGSGTGFFSSSLTQLTPATTYYVRAYATNSAGTAYGTESSFTTAVALTTLTTAEITSITSSTANSGGTITNNGGGVISASGIVWGTVTNPTITSNVGITTDGTLSGTFTSNLTGLNPGTTYYVRSYATNSAGTGYGNQTTFVSAVPCIPINTTLVIEVMSPTGRIWMDRNLGALQQASSSSDILAYGYLFQWGRGTDGHQCRNAVTTTTLSSTDQPNHGDFISGASDWRSPQNNNLWQGTNGINNPCPSGYRLPTDTEWNNERLRWSQNNSEGAFDSPLKLSYTGRRVDDTHYGYDAGFYWSSTVGSTFSGTRSRYLSLGFQAQYTNIYEQTKSNGMAVRCIKN